MKIREILKLAGIAGAVAFPPLAAAMPLINAFLPPDQRLSNVATGDDIMRSMMGLPQDRQDMILDAEIDLEKTKVIAHSEIQQSLAAVDMAGRSTRPQTVTKLTTVVCYVVVLVVTVWAIAIINKDVETIEAVNQGWPMVIAFIAPLLVVIRNYFGERTHEKNTRQHMAHGHGAPIRGLAGIVGAIGK